MKKLWIMFLAALLTAVFAASAMAGGITSNVADYVYDTGINLTLSQEGTSDIISYPYQYTSSDIQSEGSYYSALAVPGGYSGGKVLSVFTVSMVASSDLVSSVYYTNLPAAIGDKAADLYLYFTTEVGTYPDTSVSTVAVMPLSSYYHSDTKKLAITSLPAAVNSSFWTGSGGARLILVQATGTGSPTVDVTGVTLNKTALLLAKGNSAVLTATVAPANATDKSVTWESTSADVVSVDQNGKITALKGGAALITVTTTDKGMEATCEVEVTEPAASKDIHEVTPEYADTAMSADIAAALGVTSADLAIEDGKLVLSKTLQDKALVSAASQDTALKGGSLKIFPIISNDVTGGEIAAVKYTVKGKLFGVSAVTDMKVYKIFGNGDTIPFAIITSEDQRGDMTAALYKSGDIVTGSIDKTAEYTLITYVKDGGAFDLDDTANGTVVDPIAIAKAAPVKDSGSSSGCSAGFGAMTLLTLAALPFWRKKK